MSVAGSNDLAAALAGGGRPAWRRLVLPGIAALVAFAVLCGLGLWQVQRLGWKTALIARVEAQLRQPPLAAPGPAEWPTLDLAAAEYRPVSVRGRFRHDLEAHAFIAISAPKGPLGGSGFLVLTPFETVDGWLVIVNRGFVPQNRKDPATRPEGQVEGEARVTGLLRSPQGSNPFTPADNFADNVWFTRDPAAIGAHFGLPADRLAPYIIDAGYDPDLPGGMPQGGETIVTFPNSHLNYAITWFGLALGLVGVFFAYARSVLRRGRT